MSDLVARLQDLRVKRGLLSKLKYPPARFMSSLQLEAVGRSSSILRKDISEVDCSDGGDGKHFPHLISSSSSCLETPTKSIRPLQSQSVETPNPQGRDFLYDSEDSENGLFERLLADEKKKKKQPKKRSLGKGMKDVKDAKEDEESDDDFEYRAPLPNRKKKKVKHRQETPLEQANIESAKEPKQKAKVVRKTYNASCISEDPTSGEVCGLGCRPRNGMDPLCAKHSKYSEHMCKSCLKRFRIYSNNKHVGNDCYGCFVKANMDRYYVEKSMYCNHCHLHIQPFKLKANYVAHIPRFIQNLHALKKCVEGTPEEKKKAHWFGYKTLTKKVAYNKP